MSSFYCERCGVAQIDSDKGYVSGCCHYPPLDGKWCLVDFGDGQEEEAICKGNVFYRSLRAAKQHKAIHPKTWRLPNANPSP